MAHTRTQTTCVCVCVCVCARAPGVGINGTASTTTRMTEKHEAYVMPNIHSTIQHTWHIVFVSLPWKSLKIKKC